MFCANCGTKIPDGAKFCPGCGTKIENNYNIQESGDNTIKFVPAKCTNCGASLEVDPSRDAAICPYCKTPYIVSKAIKNYKITNINIGTQINIQGAEAGNLIKLAEEALSAGQYDQAVRYADRALESEPGNAGAWIIKIKTAGYDIEGDRSSEIASYIEGAINNGADDEAEENIYEAVIDVASIHIGEAIKLLSNNTDGIMRQLNSHRNKNDIAAMDSRYIMKSTRIINEAIEYRNLVPYSVVNRSDSIQVKIKNLAETYERYCDTLLKRYSLYGKSLSIKGSQLQQYNLNRIMNGLGESENKSYNPYMNNNQNHLYGEENSKGEDQVKGFFKKFF